MLRLRPLLAALRVGLSVAVALLLVEWLSYAVFGDRPPHVGKDVAFGVLAAGATYPGIEARLAAAAGDNRRAAYGSAAARLLGAAPGLVLVAILGYVVWVIARYGGWWGR